MERQHAISWLLILPQTPKNILYYQLLSIIKNYSLNKLCKYSEKTLMQLLFAAVSM